METIETSIGLCSSGWLLPSLRYNVQVNVNLMLRIKFIERWIFPLGDFFIVFVRITQCWIEERSTPYGRPILLLFVEGLIGSLLTLRM